jgi:hypothetical protein
LISKAIAIEENPGVSGCFAYIYGYVANDGCVVGQPDVARLVMTRTDSAVLAGLEGRRSGIGVDDEGALEVDAHASRSSDGAVNLVGRGHGPGPCPSWLFVRPWSLGQICHRGSGRALKTWCHVCAV